MGLSQPFARAREIVPSAGQRPSASTDGNRHVIIALCVEQGFAGVFSERVLDHAQSAAAAVAEHGHGSELVIVGDRGVMVAQQRDLPFGWSSAMVEHADQATTLACRLVDALYERLQDGNLAGVTLIHALPNASAAVEIAEKQLLPFDFAQFPTSPTTVRPSSPCRPGSSWPAYQGNMSSPNSAKH